MGACGCVLLETIDARDGSGRDRVYEERLCYAAFSVCKAFTFTAQEEGAQGGVLCRRLACGCDAATTRYAEIVLPTRVMGYVCVDADVMLRARS